MGLLLSSAGVEEGRTNEPESARRAGSLPSPDATDLVVRQVSTMRWFSHAIVVMIVIASMLLASCRQDVDRLPPETADQNQIVMAVELFRIDTGRYPTSEEGLAVLLRDPGVSGWRGPYCPESRLSVLLEYRYALEADAQFTLRSSGSPLETLENGRRPEN